MATKKPSPVSETQPAAAQCLLCKREEAPDVPGATYTSNGDNGMIISFWMCDRCAIPLGPGQGPIDVDDPTTTV